MAPGVHHTITYHPAKGAVESNLIKSCILISFVSPIFRNSCCNLKQLSWGEKGLRNPLPPSSITVSPWLLVMFAYSVAMLMGQKEDKAEVIVDDEHGNRPSKHFLSLCIPLEFIKGCDLLAFSRGDVGFFQGVISNQDSEH